MKSRQGNIIKPGLVLAALSLSLLVACNKAPETPPEPTAATEKIYVGASEYLFSV